MLHALHAGKYVLLFSVSVRDDMMISVIFRIICKYVRTLLPSGRTRKLRYYCRQTKLRPVLNMVVSNLVLDSKFAPYHQHNNYWTCHQPTGKSRGKYESTNLTNLPKSEYSRVL